ncbi:conserved Plasmodium protein, unknown function [Plasmodium gallinaceum]|uniref:Ribosome-binding factor A n=1 Tax=Plasmodium gallinaceum TaxID=5849 RepID=A0A1J1GXR5_PLAGA|nr:conserved Plasmodium protein, unknown function [Plasmodium gallinaceum]CRG97040.1 conserved Plasmodium protein, unknown function [Plasmodium gallinaceum]
MILIKVEKLIINYSKKKKFFFRTYRGSKKKEKYDDLESKHLYWCINNMKKEHLNEPNENFFQMIENDKIEENLSDIVGIKNSIPHNSRINENMKKNLFKKGNYIEPGKLEEINKIFNPSIKTLINKEKSVSNDFDNYLNNRNLEKTFDNKCNLNNNQLEKEGVCDYFSNIKKDNSNPLKINFMNRKMMKKININQVDDGHEEFLKKMKNSSSLTTNYNFIYNNKNDLKKVNNTNSNEDNNKENTKRDILNSMSDIEEYNFKNVSNSEKKDIFDYESLKEKSMYQDLTHDEYSYMNNLYIKKCDLDRKIRWFKMNNILNPIKEAKSIINSLKLSKDEEKREKEENEFLLKEDIKPYYENEGNFSHKIEKICEQNQYDEIVSRIRMKIRKEKLENSKIIKEKVPNVARHILDPIKYHVNRRKIRLEKLLQTHLEQLLNCNNSYFKFYLLNGLSISIHHLEMKSTRSVCKIVYSLLNKDVNHEMIQEKLYKVAFILRKLLARKLQLGYTPPLKFIPLNDQQQKNIKHLQYYKLYSKYNYPSDIIDNKIKNTKLIDFYDKDLSGF